MNWFKNIILSSHNLQFPEKMEEQVNDLTNKCVEYYFSKQNKKIYAGTFNFINPYTNQSDSIPVVIFPRTLEFNNIIALFNPQKRSLSVFPYDLLTIITTSTISIRVFQKKDTQTFSKF